MCGGGFSTVLGLQTGSVWFVTLTLLRHGLVSFKLAGILAAEFLRPKKNLFGDEVPKISNLISIETF